MSTSKRESKRESKKQTGRTLSNSLYARTSQQIVRASIKLGDSWTHSYTTKFQQLWNRLYLSILETETNSKLPVESLPNVNNTNDKKRNSKKKKSKQQRKSNKSSDQYVSASSVVSVPKKGDFPHLLNQICRSLQFGIMTIKFQKDKEKEKESDVLSFYFMIKFQTNYKNVYFLYLKYMYDEILAQKKKSIEDGFMEIDTEIRTKKTQITCDLEYVEKNRMINKMSSNKFKVNISLPSNVLIVVFEYLRPTKFLAFYSNIIKESDDNFVAVETDKFDKKNFNLSNIEWVGNFFGLQSWYFLRLIKILITFLETKDVLNYIEKEKNYNKKWQEWQEAQQELNEEYAKQLQHDQY